MTGTDRPIKTMEMISYYKEGPVYYPSPSSIHLYTLYHVPVPYQRAVFHNQTIYPFLTGS